MQSHGGLGVAQAVVDVAIAAVFDAGRGLALVVSGSELCELCENRSWFSTLLARKRGDGRQQAGTGKRRAGCQRAVYVRAYTYCDYTGYGFDFKARIEHAGEKSGNVFLRPLGCVAEKSGDGRGG